MFVEEKREGESQVLEPTIKNLAFVLRHQELWPKDFEWDYSHCNSCAMGLAAAIWNCFPTSKSMSDTFHIDYLTAWKIFANGNRNYLGVMRTEPKQIARALERLT